MNAQPSPESEGGGENFQPVTAADAHRLSELRVRAMRESLEAIGRFDAHRARARFLDAYVPADTRAICLDGALIGVLVVSKACDHWRLEHLYVEPAAQGRRVGSRALEAVLAEADAAGMQVRLGALKKSRSNAFYVRHGFRLVSSGDWDNDYVHEPRSVA